MPASAQPNGKRTSVAVWLVVKGFALTATGLLASAGMSFVCAMGSFHHLYQSNFKLAHLQPAAVYAAFFAAMVVWLFLAVGFAWRNRTWLGVSFSIGAFIVFAPSATNVLKFAYPVCNAF